MIYLEPRHKHIILSILANYPYTFYAFGSRTKGTHKDLSDLDLCYFENIPSSIINDLKEKFTESNLPFTIDLIDWNRCKPHFQKLIKNNLIKLNNRE